MFHQKILWIGPRPNELVISREEIPEDFLVEQRWLHLQSFPQKLVNDQKEFFQKKIAEIHQVEPRLLLNM